MYRKALSDLSAIYRFPHEYVNAAIVNLGISSAAYNDVHDRMRNRQVSPD